MTTTRGQNLIGKEIGSCILEKLLGYGGSSAVFLARQLSSEQKVAVKVFLPRSTMDKQMQKNFYSRFLSEAEAASQLDHPHILSIYSYGQHQGLPYIVMPYMPGGTLSEYVKKHGPLPLREAGQYLDEISSALDYAHEHGCVHCDVKPANILLDEAGHAMLSDFGIARLMQPDALATEQSSKSPETLMGTPDYISPEQALGQPLDGRSDIYSLGVTLFFLLTGSPPFNAESSIAVALLHVHEMPPVLGLLRADITLQIDRVMAKVLAKWPEERFQTAGEFGAAFVEAVALAEHNRQATFIDNGAEEYASASSSGAKRALAAFKPVVQIKPILKRPFKLSRVTFAVILLLPLILASAATVTIFNILTNIHSHAQVPFPTVIATIVDDLADAQDQWQTSSTYFFKNRQYHIINTSPQGIALALYGNYHYSNFRLSVTASEIRGLHNGTDYYGVVFHASADQSHYYLFDVVPWDGGQYEFLRYDGQWHTLASGAAPSLLSNPGQKNVITIVVKATTFSFSINSKPVGTPVTDYSTSALTSGEIGLCVEQQNAEVAFSQLSIQRS